MTHAFKVGMEVFIDRNQYGSNNPMQLCTVQKVTATQFTAGGERFKPWGDDAAFMVGGGKWSQVVCRVATEEMKRQNEVVKARRDAEYALRRISDKFARMRDDEAVAIFSDLPQHIKDMAKP